MDGLLCLIDRLPATDIGRRNRGPHAVALNRAGIGLIHTGRVGLISRIGLRDRSNGSRRARGAREEGILKPLDVGAAPRRHAADHRELVGHSGSESRRGGRQSIFRSDSAHDLLWQPRQDLTSPQPRWQAPGVLGRARWRSQCVGGQPRRSRCEQSGDRRQSTAGAQLLLDLRQPAHPLLARCRRR